MVAGAADSAAAERAVEVHGAESRAAAAVAGGDVVEGPNGNNTAVELVCLQIVGGSRGQNGL